MDWQQRITHMNNLSGLEQLLEIMSMLRDPENGCPWDQKQTFESIVPHTLEEAYEVADAIENGSANDIKKELGDLLFQTVFYAQLGKEQQLFDFDSIAQAMCDKLIRRHPHVFSDSKFETEQAIKQNWESEKAKERLQNNEDNISVLDDIPKALPALSKAYKIQKRAASVGFDWPNVNGAIDKVLEEIQEVQHELQQKQVSQAALADELGDLYFAITNVVRHLSLKPEQVMQQANAKFERRFRAVEKMVAAQNKQVSDVSLDELDKLWEQAKQQKLV